MANDHAPEVPVRFYRTEMGAEPVLEWLRGLERGDRRTIGMDLMRAQLGWPIGMPLVRSLKDGLWEIRSTLPSNRIARLILCFHRGLWLYFMALLKRPARRPPKTLPSRNDE